MLMYLVVYLAISSGSVSAVAFGLNETEYNMGKLWSAFSMMVQGIFVLQMSISL